MWALLFTALFATATGCAVEQANSLDLGQLKMPLSATSSGGAQYRLVGRFRVASEAAGNTTYQSEDFDGAIVLDLDPALYTVELLSNYTLEKMVEGTYYEVPDKVVLGSSNPVYMSIVAGEVTPVVFQFGVGDDAIAFGQGLGQISIQVNDGAVEPAPSMDGADGGFGGGAGGGAGGFPTSDPTEDAPCPPIGYPENGVCDDSSACSLAGDPDCE